MEAKYSFQYLTEDEKSVVKRYSPPANLVKVIDENNDYLMTVNEAFQDIKHLWRDLKLRPDDVWIITSPKCGTTWTQEITWQIMNGMQLEKTKEPLFERSPFLDLVTIMGKSVAEAEEMFKKMDEHPSPRTIKSHFPLDLLPPKLLDTCKVIFVNRNIKDACVSRYYHLCLYKDSKDDCMSGFDSEFEPFVKEAYTHGLCYVGGMPAYFAMLKCQYKNIENPNVLLLWYEDMKKDQRGMVEQIKNHLKYEISEKQIDDLTDFMKFENYQKISSLNKEFKGEGKFIRKGIVGDWRNHFDDQTAQEWDRLIDEMFDKTGIKDNRVLELVKLQE